MIQRVATNAGARMMLLNMSSASRALYTAQEQAATGKRINRMSDNPADAVNVLGQKAVLRRLDQFSRNAEEAGSWLNSTDAALSSVSEQLTSARTLLVQANSPASDATSRAAIAGQLRTLRESLLQVANTRRDGRPLFGGTANVGTTYDAAGIYQGDAGVVTLPVAPGISLQANVAGSTVFGTHNVADPTSGDVFQLLESLATAVETGNTTAIGAGITKVDAALAQVGVATVGVGGRAKQLENLVSSVEDGKVSTKRSISAKEDIDLAETMINLKTQEAAYQAALAAAAKVIQPTLLDFLR